MRTKKHPVENETPLSREDVFDVRAYHETTEALDWMFDSAMAMVDEWVRDEVDAGHQIVAAATLAAAGLADYHERLKRKTPLTQEISTALPKGWVKGVSNGQS